MHGHAPAPLPGLEDWLWIRKLLPAMKVNLRYSRLLRSGRGQNFETVTLAWTFSPVRGVNVAAAAAGRVLHEPFQDTRGQENTDE